MPKRHPAHLGGLALASFLGISPLSASCFSLAKGKSKAVVPMHQLSLIVGGRELSVLTLLLRGQGVEGKGAAADDLRWVLVRRWRR